MHNPTRFTTRHFRGNSALRGVLVFAFAACGDLHRPVAPPNTVRSMRAGEIELAAHAVAPQTTDPAITLALDDHLVWLPARGPRNGRLFLYLPSSRSTPAVSQIFEQEAARLGYLVIALSYPNTPGLASFCPTSSNPNACYDEVRRQIITGSPQTSFVAVNFTNSIDNRLRKVLQYLDMTYPDESWSQFLDGEGEIKWKKIAVGGHSQGAGHAAMIAKLRLVDRVVLLSGVTDGVGGVAATWVTVGETPADRFFALIHNRDTQFYPYDVANWTALGMNAFGGIVVPENSEPPYEATHTFVTDILPRTGNYTAPNPHASTGVDFATPLDGDGVPVLRDVWRYMLGYCPPGRGSDTEAREQVVPSCN